MAEKPIIFNTEMVRAILEGRKTQTRRLVKDIPLYEPYFEVDEGMAFVCDEDGVWHHAEAFSRIQPGDVLWVRETWQRLSDFGERRYEYRADYEDKEPLRLDGRYITWRPSIHMPKEAARLYLKVKDVRIERLQEISEDDALAEGADAGEYLDEQGNLMDVYYPHEDFAHIWDSVIKNADLPIYGWNANPWVWVITFERKN